MGLIFKILSNKRQQLLIDLLSSEADVIFGNAVAGLSVA